MNAPLCVNWPRLLPLSETASSHNLQLSLGTTLFWIETHKIMSYLAIQIVRIYERETMLSWLHQLSVSASEKVLPKTNGKKNNKARSLNRTGFDPVLSSSSGILQAVLKFVAVAAVYYISWAVPRVPHAHCWRHFLIYHDEMMHKLILTGIHSFLISTLLMSQTWDFQHFQA